MGRDGELLVTYRDKDEEAKSLGGLFQLSSQYLSLDYVEEFIFSDDSFYASDPYFGDDKTGAVWHVPNLAAQDTNTVVPEHGDVDSFGAFGTSIAVVGDILAVGAPNDNDSVGSAFIYRRQADNNTFFKEAKLVPPPSNDSSAQSFGGSVLVRDNTVIVSADHHGSDNAGAVFF